jgi:hypothetical protein
MSIVDAISSGRRIKRKHWTQYHLAGALTFTTSDILADDWQVEEPSVTVTYSQFWTAYRSIRFDPKKSEYDIVAELADHLGLKP